MENGNSLSIESSRVCCRDKLLLQQATVKHISLMSLTHLSVFIVFQIEPLTIHLTAVSCLSFTSLSQVACDKQNYGR